MTQADGWEQPAAGDGDADQPRPRWSTDDLRLETRLRDLMQRLLVDNDGSVLPEWLATIGPRLERLEDLACRSVGLCAQAGLAMEWATETAVSLSTEVPAHPLAAALEDMTARARAIANALSAQPLPDEDGYSDALPRQWMNRLGLEDVAHRPMYIQLVVLHRQPLPVRWVLRDVSIQQQSLESCAAERGLSVDDVRRLLRSGQLALLEAAERLDPGDTHG